MLLTTAAKLQIVWKSLFFVIKKVSIDSDIILWILIIWPDLNLDIFKNAQNFHFVINYHKEQKMLSRFLDSNFRQNKRERKKKKKMIIQMFFSSLRIFFERSSTTCCYVPRIDNRMKKKNEIKTEIFVWVLQRVYKLFIQINFDMLLSLVLSSWWNESLNFLLKYPKRREKKESKKRV